MKTTIDGVGRVVVPKLIRERLQLVGRVEIDIEERDGAVVLRPVDGEVQIVQTPEGPVVASTQLSPVLTDKDVRQTLERARA
ncbi:MAG: AbrB/MazE/SpoVT family DNA-binding domain-containing protein [Acidimicrobiales bacterium]